MQQLQQSEATAAQRRLFFHAVDATDGITAETGLTGVGRLSKNGAATAATSGSIVETDLTNMPGRYHIEFTAAELDTVGIIEFRFKAAACAEVIARGQVVPFDPYSALNMGLTALPAVAAEAAGGLYTRGTGAGQINQANNGEVDVDVSRFSGTAVVLSNGLPDVNIENVLGALVTAATAGRLDVNVLALDDNLVAAVNLAAWMGAGVSGVTEAGGSSTTAVDTARTELDDRWNGGAIVFTSGVIAGQMRLILDFDAAGDLITFAPAVSASVGAGFSYVIIPKAAADLQSWLGLEGGLVAPSALIAGRVDSDVAVLQTNVITAGSINANALDGKGDWNIGKTGYSLTQAFPANFSDLAILITTGRIDVGEWLGNPVTAATAGKPDVNTERWLNGLIPTQTVAGVPEVDVTHFVGGLAPPTNTTGIPDVNVAEMLDTIVSLTGGNLDVNVFAMAANVITAAAINAAALTSAKFGAGAINAAALNADAVDKIRDGLLPTQNAAFDNVNFLFVDNTDHVTPVTGATGMSVDRSIDSGTFAAGTGTGPTEIGGAVGMYQYDASPADMNGGVVTFKFSATGGTPNAPDDVFITIITGGGV